MTQAPVPQTYPAPPLPVPFVPTAGYYLAALDSDAQRKRVMQKAIKAYWAEWQAKVETYRDALQPLPSPQDRVLLYNRKPLDVWIEQRLKFPRRFEQRINDWVKLESVSPARDRMLAEMPRRELELEMQAAQMQMEAQAMAEQQAMEQASK